jgi:hypothetical protein
MMSLYFCIEFIDENVNILATVPNLFATDHDVIDIVASVFSPLDQKKFFRK